MLVGIQLVSHQGRCSCAGAAGKGKGLTLGDVVDHGQLHAVRVVVLGALYEQSHHRHSVHVVGDALGVGDPALHPPSARSGLQRDRERGAAVGSCGGGEEVSIFKTQAILR